MFPDRNYSYNLISKMNQSFQTSDCSCSLIILRMKKYISHTGCQFWDWVNKSKIFGYTSSYKITIDDRQYVRATSPAKVNEVIRG